MQRASICVLVTITVTACSPSDQATPATSAAEMPATPMARAPDRTVFGVITLGEPLQLPACKRTGQPLEACNLGSNNDGTTRVRIEALGKTYRYNWNVDVQEIAGAAEIATVQSLDNPGDDRELLRDLVKKYGPPTSTGRDRSYLAEWADWDLNGLSVYWQGRATDIPYGVAVIQTPTGRAFSAARAKADRASTPKL